MTYGKNNKTGVLKPLTSISLIEVNDLNFLKQSYSNKLQVTDQITIHSQNAVAVYSDQLKDTVDLIKHSLERTGPFISQFPEVIRCVALPCSSVL